MEIRSYQSIYRWVFRRPRVPAGAVPFSYHQPVLSILVVLLVVSVIIVAVATTGLGHDITDALSSLVGGR
jgi:hypothetical protein